MEITDTTRASVPVRPDASPAVPQSPGSAAFPRQFARTRRFSLGVPHHFTVAPDGRRVLFARTGGGRDPIGGLWSYEDGGERLLADPTALVGAGSGAVPEAERLRRERARERSEGVVSYATDRAVTLAAFALSGALWAVRTQGGEPFSVPAAGPVTDPRPSPDGRRIAYVTGRSLHVVELGEGPQDAVTDRRLAAAEGPEVSYGLAEYAAAESMGRLRGFWWSPDSRRLLVARVDTTPVQRRYISDPSDPAKPPRMTPYPAAGTANAEVTAHVLALDGTRTEVAWDRERYEYLVSAGWDAHGPLIAVQSRDQRTLRTLAVDPDTGATEVLHERTDPAWVEIVPGTPARTASGALVLPADVGDTRHLSVGGDVVTPPGLQLRAVLGVDGERVLFTASQDPLHTHVWSWEPGGAPVQLSQGPGQYGAVAGADTVVLNGLTPDGPTVRVVRGGRPAGEIGSLAEEPSVRPRPAHLTLGERELRGTLYLPSWYGANAPQDASRGGGKLPVLIDSYAGPGVQLAVAARGWFTCVSQWFAEQGFAVLVVDGRGTPGRGPRWEKEIHGDQLTPVLEDQVDALHAAARLHPALDLERVAIRGWSFGGFLAAAAVLHRPDVFHAAVAGAAPTDQRLYDTHWKERFLGHPDREPENYARSSLAGKGHLLTRPLLLVHGLADDNVAPAHALRFSAELLAAGKQHSVLPLPGSSHAPSDDAVNENLLRFQRDYLRRALNL